MIDVISCRFMRQLARLVFDQTAWVSFICLPFVVLPFMRLARSINQLLRLGVCQWSVVWIEGPIRPFPYSPLSCLLQLLPSPPFFMTDSLPQGGVLSHQYPRVRLTKTVRERTVSRQYHGNIVNFSELL